MYRKKIGFALIATMVVVLLLPDSAPAEPMSIDGLQLWLKADVGVVLDENDRVTTWQDQSGQGNDFTGTNEAKKPGYTDTWGPLGKPAVTFGFRGDTPGTDEDYLTAGEFMDFPSWTIFGVLQAQTHNPAWGMCFFADYGATGSVWMQTPGGSGHEPDYPGWGTQARSSTAGDVTLQALGGNNENLPEIVTGALDAPAQTAYLWSQSGGLLATATDENYDSTATAMGGGGVPTIGTNSQWYLGGMKGYLAELIIYDSVLSETDRLEVENYLSSKYLVPEPSTFTLLGIGLASLLLSACCKRR